MKQKILTLALLLSLILQLNGQTSGNTYQGVNQWVNGTLETNRMGCYQYNPINFYNFQMINNNTVWRTLASTRWQSICNPTGGIFGPGTYVAEAQQDANGNANGSYLYVDPRDGAGDVWQIRQTIAVKPNTNYTFSARVTTMTEPNLTGPTVGLSINGTRIVGTTTALNTIACANPMTGNWITISGTWNSGSNTSINAEIFAVDPVVSGHDFAIDNISFTGIIEVNAGMDTTYCLGDSISHILGGNPTARYGASCNAYQYAWSPTTGLNSSTIANPSLSIASLPLGVNRYIVSVTDSNNNSFNDTVYITIQQCCNLDIKVTRKGCDSFRFEEIINKTMIKKCSYWTLDGDLWNYNQEYIKLLPGKHEICNYMLVYVRVGNKVYNCCINKCVEIEIPIPDQRNIDTLYCELDSGYMFNAPSYSDCDYYILTGNSMGNILEPYDSRVNGKKIHRLEQGQYTFMCYDSNGCLRSIININVNKKIANHISCYERIVECGNIIDPNSVFPNPLKCQNCYYLAPPGVFTFTNAEKIGATRYRRFFYNHLTCTSCEFQFDIIDSACNFHPAFQIITNTLQPLTYNFQLISPLSNLCDSVIFTITDTITGITIYRFASLAPGLPFTFQFPQPGYYRVCVTVSVCVCGKKCTKTHCYKLTVNNNPPFMIAFDENNIPIQIINSEGKLEQFIPYFQIQPNPTESIFKIKEIQNKLINLDEVFVYSKNGKIVKQFSNIDTNYEFNLSDISKSMYVIVVKTNNNIYRMNLILQ